MLNMIFTYSLFCVLSTLSIVWCQESTSIDGRALIESSEFNDENLDTGNYNYKFQTSNGITRNEESHSVTRNKDLILKVAGSYSYTGPDGKLYEVKYTADETGFYPVGAHFKTPKVSPWPAQNTLDDDASDGSGIALNLSQDSDSMTVNIQAQQAFLNVSQSGSLSTVTSDNSNQELFINGSGSGSSSTVTSDNSNQQVFLNGSGSGSSSSVSSNKDVDNLYLPPASPSNKDVDKLYLPPGSPSNKDIHRLYLPPTPDADVINLLQYQNDEIGRAIKAREAIYESREAFDEDLLIPAASQVVFYITRPRGFSMLARNKPRGFSFQS